MAANEGPNRLTYQKNMFTKDSDLSAVSDKIKRLTDLYEKKEKSLEQDINEYKQASKGMVESFKRFWDNDAMLVMRQGVSNSFRSASGTMSREFSEILGSDLSIALDDIRGIIAPILGSFKDLMIIGFDKFRVRGSKVKEDEAFRIQEDIEENIAKLTGNATKKGSIYTHDIEMVKAINNLSNSFQEQEQDLIGVETTSFRKNTRSVFGVMRNTLLDIATYTSGMEVILKESNEYLYEMFVQEKQQLNFFDKWMRDFNLFVKKWIVESDEGIDRVHNRLVEIRRLLSMKFGIDESLVTVFDKRLKSWIMVAFKPIKGIMDTFTGVEKWIMKQWSWVFKKLGGKETSKFYSWDNNFEEWTNELVKLRDITKKVEGASKKTGESIEELKKAALSKGSLYVHDINNDRIQKKNEGFFTKLFAFQWIRDWKERKREKKEKKDSLWDNILGWIAFGYLSLKKGVINFFGALLHPFKTMKTLVKTFAKGFLVGLLFPFRFIGRLIKGTFKGIFAAITSPLKFLGGLFKGIAKPLRILGGVLKKIAWPIMVIMGIVDGIIGFLSTEDDIISKIVGGIKGAVDGLIELPIKILDWTTTSILNLLGFDAKGGWLEEGVKKFIDGVGNFLESLYRGWIDWTKRGVKFYAALGKVAISALWWVSSWLENLGAQSYNFLGNAINWISSKFMEYIVTPLGQFFSWIGNMFMEYVVNPLGKFFSWIGEKIVKHFGWIGDLFREYIIAPLTKFFNYLKGIFISFINVVVEIAKWIKEKALWIANKLRLKNLKKTIEGWTEGLNETSDVIFQSAETLHDKTLIAMGNLSEFPEAVFPPEFLEKGGVEKVFKTVFDTFKGVTDTVMSPSFQKEAAKKTKGLGDSILDIFQEMFDFFGGTFDDMKRAIDGNPVAKNMRNVKRGFYNGPNIDKESENAFGHMKFAIPPNFADEWELLMEANIRNSPNVNKDPLHSDRVFRDTAQEFLKRYPELKNYGNNTSVFAPQQNTATQGANHMDTSLIPDPMMWGVGQGLYDLP